VVAPSTDVVHLDELPLCWGLLVVSGDALRIKRKANVVTCRPMTRAFLGALLRRGREASPVIKEYKQRIRVAVFSACREVRDRHVREVANPLNRLINQLHHSIGDERYEEMMQLVGKLYAYEDYRSVAPGARELLEASK
jgi:hypothetical protein